MKTSLSAFFLLAIVSVNAFAGGEFEGIYQCHGNDPYLNRSYTGKVTITQQNTVYRLQMDYDTGERALGTGGQYNPSLLSVVFQDQKNKDLIGLEQYTFSDDRKIIQGYWVYLGKDKLGTEVCNKVE